MVKCAVQQSGKTNQLSPGCSDTDYSIASLSLPEEAGLLSYVRIMIDLMNQTSVILLKIPRVLWDFSEVYKAYPGLGLRK